MFVLQIRNKSTKNFHFPLVIIYNQRYVDAIEFDEGIVLNIELWWTV